MDDRRSSCARATRRTRPTRRRFGAEAAAATAGLLALFTVSAAASAADGEDAAREAAERAASYFAGTLADDGGYVWYYAADLSSRGGRGGPVDPGYALAQSPGTPAVGAAFLRLYRATGDERWLAAARDVAGALVRSQLLSGGWPLLFGTTPATREGWCYRASGITPDECKRLEGPKNRNLSSLDDNITQGALLFLLSFDEAVGGTDVAVRDALVYGLDALIEGQYDNGACPIRLPAPGRDVALDPHATARIEPLWSRAWVKPSSPPYFVFNDNSMRDCARVLLAAHRRFGEARFLAAATRLGYFLLAAQLPTPQSGWAQTYDPDLVPVWGRRFEPPAVASRETAGAVDALLDLYAATGEGSFLEGARRGAAWLEAVRLGDGRWARFYELLTDRPLYVDPDFALSYTPERLHEGYTFEGEFDIPAVLSRVRDVAADGEVGVADWWDPSARLTESEVAAAADLLVRRQDDAGRWLEDGSVHSEDFVEAIFILARRIEAGEAR